jgi:CheY-like chemotaxis protein
VRKLEPMADVLIVDDDAQLTKVSARVLAAKGHAVRTAATGREGLSILVRDPIPDCVILDVEMPQLTGPEMAYEMLRHDGGLEKVPIVLVSGRGDLADIAARVGTPYFLMKGTPDYLKVLDGLLGQALRERLAPGGAPSN